MSDNSRSSIHQQAVFTDEGTLEPDTESVETDLEYFGAEVDHRHQDRESRLDRPTASEFGVDDRPEATTSDPGEQHALFADAAADQRTLGGEQAAAQCLFERRSASTSDSQAGDD